MSGHLYDVRSFGVRADGATDDRSALQALGDLVSATGGGILNLPRATILLGSSLQMYWNNVWLRGCGRGATILKRSGGGHLVHIGEGADNAASNIKLSDLTVDGDRDNSRLTGLHNIRIENVSGCLIDNVESRNALYYGLHIRGEDAATERVTIRHTYVHSCGRDCIDVKNNGGFNDAIVFDDVVAEDAGLLDAELDTCFDFRGPMTATNLWAFPSRTGTRTHHGIRLRGLDNSSVQGRAQVSNFHVRAKSGHGDRPLVQIEGDGVKLMNGIVEGGGGDGVQIRSADVSLMNIECLNNSGHGFFLRSGS